MRSPEKGMRVYHDRYGLGTIGSIFNDEASVVDFDNYKAVDGIYLKYNIELTEINFKDNDRIFKHFCPICSRFTIYTGSCGNGLKWLRTMRGVICPHCEDTLKE